MASKKYLDLPGGVKMPIVGLGTWRASDESEVETALNAALELGYRHIDTAYVYKNEDVIGKVLNKWFTSGKIKREELFITTKLPPFGLHPDRVEHFMKKSLSNLQLDYVDLYLIHFPISFKYGGDGAPQEFITKENGDIDCESETDLVATWEKMEEQVDAGRAKAIGLSNFNVRQITRVLNSARIKPANLQIEIHVYLQQHELVDFCKENNITVVAYCPLVRPGYNKYLVASGRPPRDDLPDILTDPVINNIADKHSKTPSQVALRFLIQRGIAVIPKSISPERLKQNIDVFDFNLDDEDMNDLFSLEKGEKSRICDFTFFPGADKHEEWPL